MQATATTAGQPPPTAFNDNKMKAAAKRIIEDNKEALSQLQLLVTGINTTDIDITCYELKKRGFIPFYSLTAPSQADPSSSSTPTATASLVVTLSPKLYMKLLILNNYPVETLQHSTVDHAIRVFSYSKKIILRSGIKQTGVWLMHQPILVCLSVSPCLCLSHSLSLLSVFP
jgi:hypothetical protein